MLQLLGFGSLLLFFGSLLAIPVIIRWLPRDYFLRYGMRAAERRRRHPLMALLLLVFRNALGLCFTLAGVAMLFLPGQGLLTIVIGLSIMRFPGKDRLVARLLTAHSIQRALNWIRTRTGQAPFVFPRNSGSA